MKRILYILILLIGITSCREDENDVKEQGSVAFYLSEDPSRSTQESLFEKDDAIGVFAYEPNTKEFYATNNQFIFNGKSFQAATPEDDILITKGTDFDFYVYSPYKSEITSPYNVQHQIEDQQTRQGWIRSDFLTATHLGTITDFTVPLHFKHRLSTLEVSVGESEDISGITLDKIQANSRLNLFTGENKTEGEPLSKKMYLFSHEGGQKHYRLTLPVQNIQSLFNTVHVYNSDGSDILLKGMEDLQLKEGQIHSYHIDFKRVIRVNEYPLGGTTTGSGRYSLGTECTLSSVKVNPGYDFLGWYESGYLVEHNTNYRFKVTENRTLDVRYGSVGDWNVSLSVNPESISSQGGYAEINTSAYRDHYINGVKSEREQGHPTLSLSDNSWCSLTEDRKIKVEKNTTSSPRSVVITAALDKKSITRKLTQLAGDRNPGDWTITLSANPTSIPAKGGQTTLTAEATRNIYINGAVVDKETVTPALSYTGTGFTLKGLTLSAGNNASELQRTCKVTATVDNQKRELDIIQQAGVRSFGDWGNYIVRDLKVSAEPALLPATGGNSLLSATATRYRQREILWNGKNGYGLDTSVDEVKDVTSGTSWTGAETGFTLDGSIVKATANSGAARSITCTGSYGGKKASCRISQDAGSESFGEWSVSIGSNPSSFGPSGGQGKIIAKATRSVFMNGEYSRTQTVDLTTGISSNQSWCKVNGTNLSVSANNSIQSREAVLQVSYEKKSASCRVTQSGGNEIAGKWELTFSAEPTQIAAQGGNSTLTVQATRSFSINGQVVRTENGSDKVSLKNSNNAFTLTGHIVSIGNNTTTSLRKTTIEANIEGVQKTVEISQAAGVRSTGNWSTWTTQSIQASAEPSVIPNGGGYATLKVMVKRTHSRAIRWNGIQTDTETQSSTDDLTELASWTGSAAGFTRVGTKVTVTANPSTQSRSASYTATYDGKKSTCSLTQTGGEESVGQWTLTLSADPTRMDALGGTSNLTVKATRSITVNGQTVREEDGTSRVKLTSSNNAFRIAGKQVTVGENTAAASRSTVITADIDGIQRTCTITQGAAVITTDYIFTMDGKSNIDAFFQSDGKVKSGNGQHTIVSQKVLTINGKKQQPVTVGFQIDNSKCTWITMDQSGKMTCQENTGHVLRTGIIVLTQNEGSPKKEVKIRVTQDRKIKIDIEN